MPIIVRAAGVSRPVPIDTDNCSERAPVGTEKRGLWRLMLKLPALRGQLQLLASRSPSLGSLFEAYDDARTTLERLLGDLGKDNELIIAEYENICAEIESEVIQYCLEHHPGVPE